MADRQQTSGLDVVTLATIGARLRGRRREVEEAILGQLLANEPEPRLDEEELRRGMHETVRACLDLVLLTIENDPDWDDLPMVPPAAVVQTRRVAQSGFGLNGMLQTYIGGYSVLWDFVLEEIKRVEVNAEERAELLRLSSVRLASMAAQLLPAVAATHARESNRIRQSREERTVGIVQALLKNSLVDADELPYDVDGTHVGLVATGPLAVKVVQTVAKTMGRGLLHVCRDDGVVWGWLSGDEPVSPAGFPDLGPIASGVRLAFGEPASGRNGFRSTHRQAQSAMQVALCQRQLVTRYADVLLLVPAIQDEQAGDSLISIYLSPLEESRERSPTLKDTLQAYFEAERNTSATAARLKVDRRTAMTRLRTVEERLGFPIYKRHAELEVALRLDQLRREARAQDE